MKYEGELCWKSGLEYNESKFVELHRICLTKKVALRKEID